MEDIHTENQYTNCYIAFLDLLGFKKRIKESSCEDILRIFSEMKNPLKKIYIGKENKAHLLPGPESINTKVMSDSICFWINAKAPNALYSLLSCCAIFQAKLAGLPAHVLVRGAVVKGDIYHNGEDITFGPGLTEAYLLEENSAKYPRIILTRETLESGIKPESEIPPERYFDIIFCDSDEYMSINYLDTLKELDNKKFPPDELKTHIDEVLSKTTDSSVREKYVYLKKYYSRVFN